VPAPPLDQEAACVFVRPRALVRSRRGQRIEQVGDGDDPARNRDCVAGQPVRVTAVVELLVLKGLLAIFHAEPSRRLAFALEQAAVQPGGPDWTAC
jgi:hypothetical protein